MTISSETRKAGPFNGNGVTTSFPFVFKTFAKSDVKVIFTDADEIETILVLDSDYTVTLNVDQNANPGGSISYSTLATGEKLTVLGAVEYTQETDVQNQGGFYPEVIENAFDKITMLVQQVKEIADRAVVVPASSSVTSENYLDTINTYKLEAAASASAASTSASNADASEASALASSELANKWAEEAEDVPVETGKFSAKHWAAKAEAFGGDKLPIAGGSLAGLINQAVGSDIASASTVDLTAATGNTVRITGTTAITAFTMNAGQQMELVAVGALPLTYNATTMNINGGASYTCAAGDRLGVFKDSAGVVRVNVTKQDGTAVAAAAGVNKLQSFTAVAVGNDLVITINPDTWDFHSAALANGIPNRVTLVSAITLTIPNGATLGSVNNIASTYVVGVQNNAGTLEGFVINLAGGNQLDESNLITTTSISTGADSNNVAYATTGRSNLPYRIIGYFVNTQSTAGTYATQPTLVQPAGGQAMAALGSLGYGQTRQNVSPSRSVATTYYNLTGKPFKLFIAVLTTAAGYPSMTIGGLNYRGSYSGGAGNPSIFSEIILPNESYILNSALVSSFEWYEVR